MSARGTGCAPLEMSSFPERSHPELDTLKDGSGRDKVSAWSRALAQRAALRKCDHQINHMRVFVLELLVGRGPSVERVQIGLIPG